MKVEILGSGCAKCEELARNARQAISESGVYAEIVKITDIVEIADRGAMMTPALVVDGEIKVAGKVATVKEIVELLS